MWSFPAHTDKTRGDVFTPKGVTLDQLFSSFYSEGDKTMQPVSSEEGAAPPLQTLQAGLGRALSSLEWLKMSLCMAGSWIR